MSSAREQLAVFGGALVDERSVAGERELRGEEQLPVGLPGVRAGSIRKTQRAEQEGAEVRGCGEVRRTSGGAGVGVLIGLNGRAQAQPAPSNARASDKSSILKGLAPALLFKLWAASIV